MHAITHTHPYTHPHCKQSKRQVSSPRRPHPPRHHREVLLRSSGAARKDSCTACERTAFTPCRRTHSAVDTRRRWREEPTSTLYPPRHPRQHPRAPPRRWSKAPTTPRTAAPPHPHSARAAAARTPTPTYRNPAMQGLGTPAPPPRSRRHRAHPNARHPRPPDPGLRTPPLQPRRAPARHRTAPRPRAWHTDAILVCLSRRPVGGGCCFRLTEFILPPPHPSELPPRK